MSQSSSSLRQHHLSHSFISGNSVALPTVNLNFKNFNETWFRLIQEFLKSETVKLDEIVQRKRVARRLSRRSSRNLLATRYWRDSWRTLTIMSLIQSDTATSGVCSRYMTSTRDYKWSDGIGAKPFAERCRAPLPLFFGPYPSHYSLRSFRTGKQYTWQGVLKKMRPGKKISGHTECCELLRQFNRLWSVGSVTRSETILKRLWCLEIIPSEILKIIIMIVLILLKFIAVKWKV